MCMCVCVCVYVCVRILPSKGTLLEFDKVKYNTQKMQNPKISTFI